MRQMLGKPMSSSAENNPINNDNLSNSSGVYEAKRWKIVIEYVGTDYAGWQRQDHVKSVQQSIEEAIYKFCGQDIRIHVAGRTDAGVHAKGQVAHFDLNYGSRPLSGFDLTKAINAHLRPQPISIVNAQIADKDFHARFSALEKTYKYRIVVRSSPPATEYGKIWHVHKEINVNAMRDATKFLIGKHDFSTFRASQCQAKSPIRNLDSLTIEEKPYDDFGGKEIIITARARSFLHHQIRNIVGTLMLVGEGKWIPEDIKTALEAKDRKEGGPTAPACGLYLVNILYG